jgi:hypothetical protein
MLFPATVPANITTMRSSIERLADIFASVYPLRPAVILPDRAAKRFHSTSSAASGRRKKISHYNPLANARDPVPKSEQVAKLLPSISQKE